MPSRDQLSSFTALPARLEGTQREKGRDHVEAIDRDQLREFNRTALYLYAACIPEGCLHQENPKVLGPVAKNRQNALASSPEISRQCTCRVEPFATMPPGAAESLHFT